MCEKVRQMKVVHENRTIKHLVYKLWVSDCETEKRNGKRAKMLHQPPLPAHLTFWIYFKFLSFKFTEVNLLYLGLSPVLFGT